MEDGAAAAHDRRMDTVNDTIPPTDTPPPYRRPGRLTRATDDKVVAGVAGGLGRYFGIDPVVFRIAFVVLALAGGSGVLLYLLAWLVVPDDSGAVALPRIGSERNHKLVTAVLVGGGLLIVLDQLGNRGDGDLPVGVVLVAVGALVLWSRRDHHHDDAAPAAPSPAPPIPPTGDTEPAPAPPSVASPEARSPKPRSALVPVTLSLLAVLAGALTLVGVSATTGLALALLLTGGALVVGSWRGRARWLIPVGLALAVALAAVSLVDVPVRGTWGDATFRAATLDEVHSPYRMAIGDMTVDLSTLDLAGSTVTVVASVAAGNLVVVVPGGAAVELDAHVGGGDLNLLGHHADGIDVRRQVSEPGVEGRGRLILRTRSGVGDVEVRRASA
jgi:phage shock protein PspC (stress-responsive transcriptional regulator)